jgi:alpha-ketoglutaric semialdehyde dehydrogenase
VEPLHASVDSACEAARSAWAGRASWHPRRAELLEALALGLERARDEIIATCARETGLTPEELAPEFARATGTLRLFADLLNSGPAWQRPARDRAHAGPTRWGGPGHDVARLLVPLGPVAVFGAGNFPLAYGVAGGDTASAIAAGCPVIVKEHPDHRETGRLIAHTLAQAAKPVIVRSPVQYVLDEGPDHARVGASLVDHPAVRAVGFTGSQRGGMAIVDRAANRRSARASTGESRDPIPVFAEMGSANAVIITPAAWQARSAEITRLLTRMLLDRVGQQCTAPSLIIAPESGGAVFDALAPALAAEPPRRMLSPRVAAEYHGRCDQLRAAGSLQRQTQAASAAQRADGLGVPLLGLADAGEALRTPALWHETFGPAAVVLSGGNALAAVDRLEPALVASVFIEEHDLAGHGSPWRSACEALGEKVGRLVFSGPTTGVRVAPGMVHGGPFPATNRPESTAVGPLAIERWCRLACLQNAPDALLPESPR